MSDEPYIRTAVISDDGLYRYRLERVWDDARPALPFVMLNPSTADALVDDPTIRRCVGFARRENAGGIIVCNLYAFRATSPADLWKARDPYGPQQDDELRTLSEYARLTGMPIVCGWGIHGGSWNKPIMMLQTHSPRLACLGRTKDGKPRHPLYVRADQPLEGFLM